MPFIIRAGAGLDHTSRGNAPNESWRVVLGAFLEGFPVQLAIMGLLILDVACVIGEISLGVVCVPELADLQAQLDAAKASGANATAHSSTTGGDGHHRFLRGGGGPVGRALSSAGGSSHASTVHDVEHALHIASLTILSVFLAHLLGLVVAFGVRNFVHHCFYVLDLVVVTVAIALESLQSPAGELVIILLFWRLLRIGHGVFASELVAVERVQHTRHRLHAVRKRLFAARSYTATRLRLTLMRTAATAIVYWWREHRRDGAGSEAESWSGGSRAGADGAASAGAATPVRLDEGGDEPERKVVRRMRMVLRGDLADEALEDAATSVRLGAMAMLPRDERAEAARRGMTSSHLDSHAERAKEGRDADDVEITLHGDRHMPLQEAASSSAGPSARRKRRPLHSALDALKMDTGDLLESPGASTP